LDRRRFLHGITATAGLTAASPYVRNAFAVEDVADTGRIDSVAVIGAGIIGASIAYNLVKRGCEVVVIEQNAPASQASGNSFAWINASYFESLHSYYTLRTHSLNEYHRLAQDVEIPIRWGGSLEWYASDEQQIEVIEGVRRIQESGAPTWMIDTQSASTIDPNVRIDDSRQIAWCNRDGAIDPAGTTRALLDRVVGYGGRVFHPATVTDITQQRDGVRVVTNVGAFEADMAVVAAGVGASEIARMIGLGVDPLRPARPGIIVTTEPMEPLLNTVAYTTGTHFHQRSDGRVIIGEKAGSPQTDEHLAFLTERPNSFPAPELANEHAARIIDLARRYVPQLADANVKRVGVGWRPLPRDGLPVVGHPEAAPGIYLAAMHSGVTLAPIIGHLAAMEILDGVRVNLLADFRYERF
jgi:glycine/D-amino acid oxidase-like deaminating enzyme